MYSLNVPVPGEVAALATSLARDLPGARARTRGEHTLVVKRLGAGDRGEYQQVSAHVREALAGTPPFEVRVTGIEYFREAPVGSAPVVYLAVESPGVETLHRHLCETVAPVEGIEAEDYTPHVTVARGGTLAGAERLAARAVDPVAWTVTELQFWDAERSLPAGSVALSA